MVMDQSVEIYIGESRSVSMDDLDGGNTDGNVDILRENLSTKGEPNDENKNHVIQPEAACSSPSASHHYQCHSYVYSDGTEDSIRDQHDDQELDSHLPVGNNAHSCCGDASPNDEKDDQSTLPSLSNEANDEHTKQVSDSKRQLQETTRLNDIIGHDEVKLRIRELTLPLALPESILQSVFKGIRRLPTTILLHGPPGCGKTKLARAIAGEAEAALIQVAPSDVLSKFVGESEGFIQKVFCEAVHQGAVLESRCAVIFFDEIDALGQDREHSGVGEGEACSRRVLTELLLQLNVVLDRKICKLEDFRGRDDTDEKNSIADRKVRIVVAAATNRPYDCDSALLRRFELKLDVGLPSARDRLLMINKHLQDIDNNLKKHELNLLAAFTVDWSGSAIETLCRDAVQAPVRECIRHALFIGERDDHGSSTGSVDAYNALLSGISGLRPVSLDDFRKSIHHQTGDILPEICYEQYSDELSPSQKRPRVGGHIGIDSTSSDGRTFSKDNET